ncbi:MAG: M20 family metallopeptidase [Oscillibacter sp.]
MERILQRWYDMISIRSVNGHEAQMADYVANVLRELGMDPHYSYFEEDTACERPSVWSVLDSGRPGKTVLLIGHLDTVDVSDRWKTDPFTPTEIDGKVYGRGAMDMKGGLAAILETLTYYAAHLDEINGKILACFVADEEGLSKGTYQLVAEDVIHADYAIMGECRYDNVAVGFRGRYSFEVTVHGQTAHASHYPRSVKTLSSPADAWPRPSRRCRRSSTRTSSTARGACAIWRAAIPARSLCRRSATSSLTATSFRARRTRSALRRSWRRRSSSAFPARSMCASSRENRPTCSRSRWRRIIRLSKFCRRSFTPSRARTFRAHTTPRSAIRIF